VSDHTRYCAAGRACRGWDPLAGEPDEHGKPTGTPTPDPPHTLCDPCLEHAARAIRQLPFDWRDLEQALPPALGVWSDGPRGASKEPPAPLSVAVEALQAAIHRAVTSWEDVVRERAQLSEVPRRRPLPMRPVWVATVDTVLGAVQRPYMVHPSAQLREIRPGPIDVVRGVRVIVPRLGMLSDVGPVEMVDYPMEHIVGPLYRPGKEPHERWDTVRHFRGVTYATVPGWQGVLDLATLHRRVLSVLGLTAPVKRLPGVCPHGHEDLQQDAPRWPRHEPHVYCGQCGWWQPYEDWLQQARRWGGGTAVAVH